MAEKPKMTGPIALVTKFPVSTCRECGEPIKLGERVWWMRAVGTAHLTCGPGKPGSISGSTAHLTCGWTLPNGKVHSGTLSSIRDIPASAGISDTEYVPLYAQRPPVSRRDKNKGKADGI